MQLRYSVAVPVVQATAAPLTQPLAWELPYAAGATAKREGKKKKKHEKPWEKEIPQDHKIREALQSHVF